ncbi:MAG TPA: hypothetical protein PK948_06655 [Gemmatimonadales bacterium]|nr:hypothetical protein [Gemmatimonadales bacterium]
MSQDWVAGALHASAPPGLKCADCTIDREPCPSCYISAWRERHPGRVHHVAEATAEAGALTDVIAVDYATNGEDRPILLRRLAQAWLDRNSESPIHQATVDAFAAGNALMEAMDMYSAQVSEVRSLRERIGDHWPEVRTLRAEVKRLEALVSEKGSDNARLVEERDSYRAAAKEWERLRGEAYALYRSAEEKNVNHAAALRKLDDDWSAARKAALDEAATWERRAKSAVIEAETNMVQIERLRDIAALQLNGLMEIRQLAAAGESSTVIQEKISATIGASLHLSMVAEPLSAEIGRYPALGVCGGDTMHDGAVPHPQCSLYSWRRSTPGPALAAAPEPEPVLSVLGVCDHEWQPPHYRREVCRNWRPLPGREGGGR